MGHSFFANIQLRVWLMELQIEFSKFERVLMTILDRPVTEFSVVFLLSGCHVDVY